MRRLLFPLSVLVLLVAAGLQAQTYTFTTVAGHPSRGSAEGTGATAEFWFPGGAVLDGSGGLLVADTYNHTIRKIVPATGDVSTWAGVAGQPGNTDGSTQARFNLPTGMVADDGGNIYVADTGNHTIRKITPDGMVSTLAGQAGVPGAVDAAGTLAAFSSPQGVGIDRVRGILYVGDTGNHVVRSIQLATAEVTTVAGSAGAAGRVDGTGSAARFRQPVGIAVSSVGVVYVADSGNGTLRQITTAGVVTTVAGQPTQQAFADGFGQAARFNEPMLLAIDGADRVYVADMGNNAVRRMDGSARVTTLGDRSLTYPHGIAVDAAGTVYVADTGSHSVRKIVAAEGVISAVAGRAGDGTNDGVGRAAGFDTPEAMAVEPAGSVVIADTGNHTIRRVALDGRVTTIAGTAGVAGSSDGPGTIRALFNQPGGVTSDFLGNLYVADTGNHTIRKITPDGVVSTIAGSPGAAGAVNGASGVARFNSPHGIVMDATGSLFVADSLNHVIRKISVAGVVSTFAGAVGIAGSADGATGGSARFNQPQGLAIDALGNLYVADKLNSCIRQITPAGSVTTMAGLAGTSGSADGTGLLARFNQPTGVAMDGQGNVIVADFNNQLVRRVTPGKVVDTLAGQAWAGLNSTIALQFPPYGGDADGLGSVATFYHPVAVGVDGEGRLFVLDRDSHTLRLGSMTADPGAPVISQHPLSLNVAPNTPASFHVSATGSGGGGLAYQWLKNGVPMLNETSDTLSIASATSANEATYSVVVSSASLSVTSYGALLRVIQAPVITAPPIAVTINDGQTAVFKVKATGLYLGYQWKKGVADVPLAVTDTLTLSNVQFADIASYSVVITNLGGTATSVPVPLYVLIAPAVAAGGGPVDVISARSAMTPVTFAVTATGNPLAYQWLKNGVAMPGKTSATLALSNPQFTDAASYAVRLTNSRGSVTSAAAQLVVVDQGATSLNLVTGHTAAINAPAAGSILSYQWKKGGSVILPDTAKYVGLGTKTLQVKTLLNPDDQGAYTCVITGKGGALESGPINLGVTIKPVVNAFTVPDLRVSQPLSPVVTLTAANGPTAFVVTGLPSGMSYSAASGVISGRPLVSGTFTLSATASNAAGSSLVPVQSVFHVSPLQDGTVGSFQGPGLQRDAALNNSLGGRLVVTVAVNGSFTGSLVQGTTSYPLAGALTTSLTLDPSATVSIGKGAAALALNLALIPSTRSLTATLSDGGSSVVHFNAWLPSATAANYAGNYTFATRLQVADQGDDSKPQGYGFGAFQVASSGATTGVLKLADGSSVTWSGVIGEGGNLGLFGLLYGNTGSVVGQLGIDSSSGFSLGASALDWLKKPQTLATRYFKTGFGPLQPTVVGRKYAIPGPGLIALGLSAPASIGAGNAKLSFADGGAPSPATRLNVTGLELKSGNPSPVTMPSGNPGMVKLTVTPGSGTAFTTGTTGGFGGSFTLIDLDSSLKPVIRAPAFLGMIVNDGSGLKGYGYFLLPQMPGVGTTATTSPYFSGRVVLEGTP